MLRYILKKTVQLVPVLLVATILIFAMIKACGLNPVLATLGGGRLSQAVLENKMAKYGLDQPLPLQYLYWLKNVLTGNFGSSVKYKTDVLTLIKESLPVTLGLVLFSFFTAQITAVLLGILAAVKQNTIVDKGITILTLLFFSTPVFFSGILIIFFLAHFAPNYAFTGSYHNFREYLLRLAPAVLVLCFQQIALITKITRSSMIDQLNSDYILILKAKGLSRNKIIFKHALKNGIIPVITISGIQFGALIAGSVMVENLFSLPGLGRLLIQCILVGDAAVVQGVTLLIVAVFLLTNLIVETLYAVIDPRIRNYEAGV